jgi:hypothetical protein
MLSGLTHGRERAAGLLMLLFGLVAVVEGRRLGVGTLSEMGPGFVPLALGLAQCGLGVIIALAMGEAETEDPAPHAPDWRGALCIVAGAIAFIGLGRFAGLVPAIFGSVLIAALGDRATRPRTAVLLAGGVTVFGCVLFSMILQIPIPLIQGLQ